jgi:hypothetical protein
LLHQLFSYPTFGINPPLSAHIPLIPGLIATQFIVGQWRFDCSRFELTVCPSCRTSRWGRKRGQSWSKGPHPVGSECRRWWASSPLKWRW